jgi:ABC-type cobalamin/Fe3+-siderophores transport system ATPase subunit
VAVLSLENVGYEIAGKRLLHALRLKIRPGRLLAIVGPNGAGKSTLLRIVAGVLRSEGAIYVDETSVATMSRRQRARNIAFVPADDTLIDELTVWDVVAEGRHAHRRSAIDRAPEHDAAIEAALVRVGLETFKHRPFNELSSGERRRTWIALGLAQEAPIILLDEPTAHLDFRFSQQTLRLMREIVDERRCIVAVLHDLNEAAQVADEIALLDAGRMVAIGAPSEVLTAVNIARCYGVDVDIFETRNASIRIFART